MKSDAAPLQQNELQEHNEPYEVTFPSSRRLTFDLGKIGLGIHHVKGFLEIDVTEARQRVREIRRGNKSFSFLAWLLKTAADCVAEHPPVNGFRKGNKIVVFPDVDIAIALEKEIGGEPVPLMYIVRGANQKSVEQIYEEIQAAKTQGVEKKSGYFLEKESRLSYMGLFISLPQWLRLALMRAFFFTNPRFMKQMIGNMMVTTVGMVGHVKGWIVPVSMHPLCLAFGSLDQTPLVYKGEIQKREILHLTVMVDHDVIDGAPAARFIDDLVRRLDNATGL